MNKDKRLDVDTIWLVRLFQFSISIVSISTSFPLLSATTLVTQAFP